MRKTGISENPAFTFRTFLLRLGLIGTEYKNVRAHLLENLPGDKAWRYDKSCSLRSYDDLWNELLYGVALGGGNGDLVTVTQSQVGNVGGTPYWSWYGFSSRVEWWAIFVSWCAEQCGLIDSGAVLNFSGCGTGVNWFQFKDQWLPGSATPEPGMLIFFKWYGSDALIADHVGIVERVENGRFYTIEGNSNNMVRRNTEKITNHEGWLLAGIFADDGISGVRTKNRDQFNEMIELCRQGKIDLILTKSISRFARNTLDCIQHVRLLKS